MLVHTTRPPHASTKVLASLAETALHLSMRSSVVFQVRVHITLLRPPDPSLNAKPLAMGASTGNFGTVRAQMHLRQVCAFTNMIPLNKPELLVMRAQEKFDANGRLVDEKTREFLRDLLVALASWTRLVHPDGMG